MVKERRVPPIALLVIGLIVGLVIATAVYNRSAFTGRPNGPAQSERVYAMNVAISSMPFWTEPKHTWEAIGHQTPGVRTLFGGPDKADTTDQAAQIDALLTQNITGLVVFSTDPDALVPTVNKAVEKGIPVVTVFADLPKSKRLAYIGANQMESARAVARRAMQDFPERVKATSKVLISVGKIGAEDQDERRKGFVQEVGKQMTVIGPVIDEYKPDKAAEVIKAALIAHPDIKFIFGCDSQSALGAITALTELKRKPTDVIITAWDSEAVVLSEIKGIGGRPGWVHATAVLYSSYMVQTAFSFLEAAHFGYLYAAKPSGEVSAPQVPAAPVVIEIPIRIITANNVSEILSAQPNSK